MEDLEKKLAEKEKYLAVVQNELIAVVSQIQLLKELLGKTEPKNAPSNV